MLYKVKIVNFSLLILHFLLFANIFSQNIEGVNARLDAMAGSAAADDIGWTIRHPASIFKFPNQFQGSVRLLDTPGAGKTYGEIIGIVRFNDFLFAGLTFNNRYLMGGWFYDEAAIFLNAPHISSTSVKEVPNVPQVNLCLKLNDNIQFGIGGYFENQRYNSNEEKKIAYNVTGGGSDTIIYRYAQDNKRLRSNGFNVEARFMIGSLTIYPQITVGFPLIGGSEYADTLDGAQKYFALNNAANIDTFVNLKHTWSTPQSLNLSAGSYFWGDIGNTFWFTGVIYENQRFQFVRNTKREVGAVDVDGSLVGGTLLNYENFDTSHSDHNDHWVHYFLSFVPDFSDNLYFSPEYNGGIGWYTAKDPEDPSDTTFLAMYHNFRLGIEKSIDDFWWFDRLALRCGFQGQWNKQWRYVDNFDNVTGTSNESIPWKSFFWGSDFTKKEAKITGGFGVSRGRGTFDISCKFLDWQNQGVLNGPSAAMATITVDFSRKKEF